MSEDPARPSGSPLRVERLEARGFRNLVPLEFEPGPRFNVLAGDNGAGKSSLLEAIAYVASLRSFRAGRTEDVIQLGAESALLDARVVGDLATRRFQIRLHRTEARKMAIDGKRPRTLAAWCATLPAVVFHPGDLELLSGSAERRRAYLDRLLEQLDPVYASTLADYEKALRSRNRLLKDESIDRRAIVVYDELLATRGAILGRARAAVVRALGPRIEAAFSAIVGADVPLSVRYLPRVAPDVEALRAALEASFAKDVARGFTADGPHADELGIAMKKVAARHHASQGQHRAMALAMKLAELDELAARSGRVPLLLLDDVSSELDRERNRRLFERIAAVGGQVFLTTTQAELIRLDHDRVDFEVAHGRVVRR